jgi:hypothetical protein
VTGGFLRRAQLHGVSYDSIIMNDELGRMWKERAKEFF